MPTLTTFERVARALVPDRATHTMLDAEQTLRDWGAKIIDKWDRAHGQTTWTPSGPVVRTSPARSPGRRNSTLAHEFGHLTLEPIGDGLQANPHIPLAHQQRLQQVLHNDFSVVEELLLDTSLERACDALAWELLLPRAWSVNLVSQVAGLDDARDAARMFGVSLSFLTLRLNEHNAGLMLLRLLPARGGEWIVADTAAALDNWLEGAIIDKRSSSHLTELRRHRSTETTCLRNVEDGEYFDCEVSVGRYGAYALGHLPRRPASHE